MRKILRSLGMGAIAAFGASACAPSGGSRVPFEQTYLMARHNWAFRRHFPDADRLLNAFDYGHAASYRALTERQDSTAGTKLDGAEFDFITGRLLPRPPMVPLDEGAIAPDFATLAPEALAMFEWAHMLHRQLYDIWSAPNMTEAQRDRESRRAIEYYRSRRDLAFSIVPKSMDLMEGQPYSRIFRAHAPKYNGLLWSYHWYQLALHDALLGARDDSDRRLRVDSVRRTFFSMIADAPSHMPAEMPMAPSIAPLLSARYPEAAIIFDNLHAFHDVVSDILMSPLVPRAGKREALLGAADVYRDSVTAVISLGEWRAMGAMPAMGRPER